MRVFVRWPLATRERSSAPPRRSWAGLKGGGLRWLVLAGFSWYFVYTPLHLLLACHDAHAESPDACRQPAVDEHCHKAHGGEHQPHCVGPHVLPLAAYSPSTVKAYDLVAPTATPPLFPPSPVRFGPPLAQDPRPPRAPPDPARPRAPPLA
ncbi:MAG: hypothetical protein M5U12_16985 [Verrucomicrobia bacterium]|nr:hypothetical protein [Verrucomicrobiota bacterium]